MNLQPSLNVGVNRVIDQGAYETDEITHSYRIALHAGQAQLISSCCWCLA